MSRSKSSHVPVCNDTRWRALQALVLRQPMEARPRFRTRCLTNGFVSDWDREWTYHFIEGGFSDIEWVELAFPGGLDPAQVAAVCDIGFVGERTGDALRLFGYLPRGREARKLRPEDFALEGEGFAANWQRAFGRVAPSGWQLRQAYPHRWTRFHTLEQSKRYSQTPSEVATVLARLNAVAAECFEAGRAVLLVVTAETLAALTSAGAAAALSFDPVQGCFDEQGEDADQIFAARVVWQETRSTGSLRKSPMMRYARFSLIRKRSVRSRLTTAGLIYSLQALKISPEWKTGFLIGCPSGMTSCEATIS